MEKVHPPILSSNLISFIFDLYLPKSLGKYLVAGLPPEQVLNYPQYADTVPNSVFGNAHWFNVYSYNYILNPPGAGNPYGANGT